MAVLHRFLLYNTVEKFNCDFITFADRREKKSNIIYSMMLIPILTVGGCLLLGDAIYREKKIYTHYYSINLIWRTASRRVDEVIPSDHPRREGSRVIQWYGLIHET